MSTWHIHAVLSWWNRGLAKPEVVDLEGSRSFRCIAMGFYQYGVFSLGVGEHSCDRAYVQFRKAKQVISHLTREERCAQLSRGEQNAGSRFTDAGVSWIRLGVGEIN